MALVATWKQELAAGRPLRAFTNMTMAPTPVDLVASAIAHVMEDHLPVVAQLTGPRDVSYAEVGRFQVGILSCGEASDSTQFSRQSRKKHG
jgi:dTDP-4-dehydrorhamnose reductase